MPLRSAAGRSQQVSIPCGIGRPKPPACGSPDGSRFSAAGRSFAWQRPAARVRSCVPSQAAARKIRVQRVPFAAASFGGGLPLAAGSMRLRASARAVCRSLLAEGCCSPQARCVFARQRVPFAAAPRGGRQVRRQAAHRPSRRRRRTLAYSVSRTEQADSRPKTRVRPLPPPSANALPRFCARKRNKPVSAVPCGAAPSLAGRPSETAPPAKK